MIFWRVEARVGLGDRTGARCEVTRRARGAPSESRVQLAGARARQTDRQTRVETGQSKRGIDAKRDETSERPVLTFVSASSESTPTCCPSRAAVVSSVPCSSMRRISSEPVSLTSGPGSGVCVSLCVSGMIMARRRRGPGWYLAVCGPFKSKLLIWPRNQPNECGALDGRVNSGAIRLPNQERRRPTRSRYPFIRDSASSPPGSMTRRTGGRGEALSIALRL